MTEIIAETPRMRIRTWSLDDIFSAHAFWGDPEVMRYAGEPHHDLERTRRAIRGGIKSQEENGFCIWALELKENGRVIGCCGFHDADEEIPGALELVFHLNKRVWRHGLATEAVATSLEVAFKHLNRKIIIAGCEPENTDSLRILQKFGFREYGHQDTARMFRLDAPDT